MIKDISVTCEDSTHLTATLYTPERAIKGAVMIAPATGIKRQFYAAFANYLCEQGFGVITFDNRGIAESLKGKIEHSKASLVTCGQQDMPAVLETLKMHFPKTQYFLVGHSAGGQLLGLMPNVNDLTAFCNFGSSSGSLRNMRAGYLLKAHFFMNFYIPLNNLLFGHTKSHLVGMGEPLPKGVSRQWQKWCNGQGYVKEAFGKEVLRHWYDDIRLPSKWILATDDDIANLSNVKDMISVFPELEADIRLLNPDDYDLAEIGHMKFFSRKCQALWPEVSGFLSSHSVLSASETHSPVM